MKKLLLSIALVLGLAAPAAAQITVPNTFVSGTRILASEMNANFDQIESKALARDGTGVATGTISTQTLSPSTDNTYFLGTSVLRYNQLFLGDNGLFIHKDATTGGPVIEFDSSHVAGSDFVGGIIFGLNGTRVSAFATFEFSTDDYGLGFYTYPGGAITEALRITEAGEMTAARQPGFLAYNSADDANADGATFDFDTEVYDDGGDFAADTFTAPVTGRYLFCTSVEFEDSSAVDPNNINLRLVTTSRSYILDRANENAGIDVDGVGWTLNGCVIAAMAASDTAVVQIHGATHSGRGSSSPHRSTFSGRLLP